MLSAATVILWKGASNEAASIAGHQKLGKLIWIYDDNHISIEGDTKIAYSDDVAQRFKGYHWHIQDIGDKANDIDAFPMQSKMLKKRNRKTFIDNYSLSYWVWCSQ